LSFSRQRLSSPPAANSPATALHYPPNVSSSLEGPPSPSWRSSWACGRNRGPSPGALDDDVTPA
jgi:hypothetical protein